jgi:hypothetical protein
MTPTLLAERRDIFKENLRRFLANEAFVYTVDKSGGF